MRTLKYISVILGIFVCAASLYAVDVETVLQKRDQASQLPPSDSVILYHGTTFTIHEDGRMDRQEHLLRYLRNLNAWDEYCDPHLAFDSQWQELDVMISRVHTPDGRKVDTTPNGFNPIVPFGLDRAPDFTTMRQMVVTHLGVEHDVVTELKYTVSDTEPLYPWSWGEVLFGTHEPTLEREVIVKVPVGSVLALGWRKDALQYTKSERDGYQIATWRMMNLESIDLAETGSKAALFLPRVSFSTCPNMEELTNEMQKRFGDAAKTCCSFDKAIEDYAKISSPEVKLDSAITFIKNRIALKRFNHPTMLLKYRPTCRISNTGYGSVADLTVYYATVLKELGFEPKVYLSGIGHESVPGLAGNEHYAIHLTGLTNECWLDPTTGNISYGLPEGVTLLGIWPAQTPETIPPTKWEENSIRLDLEITFDAEGAAEGWVQVKSTGALAFFETAIEGGAGDLIDHFTNGFYVSPEVNNEILLQQQPDWVEGKADLSFDPVEEKIDGMIRIPLPWNITDFHGILPRGLVLHHVNRDVPVILDRIGYVEINLKFNYPAGIEPVLLPQVLNEKVDGISFDRKVETGAGFVRIEERAEFPQMLISAEGWELWRQVILSADRQTSRTILLPLN
ncbi:hypothetical protein CEE37_08315 [candidate division LCP-89 bacterium B3_LCP]|uniref:DUF3857 domain-containing protein n=1 Tax=candidate division LCP-89 bacterium B3_LCP TaxID=2012998 RepID=A0A532UZD8_UNCL8|nr:MAG: hypothetical protein CEE37_08315 [candidate division LCP-89 bacterium B3_LCP]